VASDSKPSDAEVLRQVQALPPAPILRGLDDQLYRYNGKCWDRRGDDEVQARLGCIYGTDFNAALARNVRYLLRGVEPMMPSTPAGEAKYVINAANGSIDITAHPHPLLRPHSPDDGFQYVLDHDYDPNASCPNIDASLAKMFPDPDMVGLIHEVFGYCLLPGFNLKKAILLYSRAPHTGKSTLLNLLGALVGHENEATVSLQDLDDHRFARASLQGKLVNRSGDLGAYAPRTSTVFKSIVGGDPVLAEHKGQQTFPLYNTAKLLFAGNSFAGTHESGEAYSQRWLVIPFTVEHESNPDFLNLITTPDELRGLLRHAVNGAARLVARKQFLRPVDVELAEAALQLETDSVRRFVNEVLTIIPIDSDDKGLLGKGLYDNYKVWATDSGLRPVGAPQFYTRLGDTPGVKIVEGHSRKRFVQGVRMGFPSADPEAIRTRWKEAAKNE
jgi:putative DNA primase/helicase